MSKFSHKTILFDLDGTLYDSIPTILATFQEVSVCLNVPYPGDETVKSLIGTHLYSILGSFLRNDQLEAGATLYRRIYLSRQNKGTIQLFPDVLSILQELVQKNYTLGIVTTKYRQYSEDLLKQSRIFDLFDVIIGSEDVERHKPLPDPLLKATTDLSVSTSEAVYIGDALIDLQAARAANMDFIAVTTGTTSAEAFTAQKQNTILPNLTALPLFLYSFA